MHKARAFFFVCAGVFLLGSRAEAGPPPWPANYLLGLISGHRTLTHAYPGPFYYMVGDLTVAPGATLTVEPGCTVAFAATDTLHGGVDPERVEFNINGTLLCQGDIADSIWFMVAQPGRGAYWTLSAGASANLSYCSGVGLTAASGSAVTLADCSTGGISLYGSATMVGCAVHGSVQGGNLSMQSCTITGGGLYCGGWTSVQRCSFTGPGAPVECSLGADGWLLGDGSVGIDASGGGQVTISDPSPSDPRPTVVIGYWKGVSGGTASNVLVQSCTYGFCDGCRANYCTAYGCAVGFGDLFTQGVAKNCIAADNIDSGFMNFGVTYSDSWSNAAHPCFCGDQYCACSNMLMTASWDPFFMNAPSDLRLRPESIFMGWSDTGCQIGAYGPGAGPPVAARKTTWGQLKTKYR